MADAQCALCALHCSEIPWRCSFRGVRMQMLPCGPGLARGHEHRGWGKSHTAREHGAGGCGVQCVRSGSQGHWSWVRGDRTRCVLRHLAARSAVSLRPLLYEDPRGIKTDERGVCMARREERGKAAATPSP